MYSSECECHKELDQSTGIYLLQEETQAKRKRGKVKLPEGISSSVYLQFMLQCTFSKYSHGRQRFSFFERAVHFLRYSA